MKLSGILEIDHNRGVIYFHADDPSMIALFGTVSVLRICKLPTPIPYRKPLDLSGGHNPGYSVEEKEPGL